MSPRIGEATDALRRFLFTKIYKVLSGTDSTQQANAAVYSLYRHLVSHQELLPPEYLSYSDEPARRVVDYIAGMTDLYALRLAEEISA